MQLKNCQSQENLAEDPRDGDACPNGSISPILDIAPACLACLASGSDQTWRAEGGQECPCRNLVKLHLTFLFTGFSISGKYPKRYIPPHSKAVWQKLWKARRAFSEKVGLRRKFYFVAILRFVAINTLFGRLQANTVFLGQEDHYFMAYNIYCILY